MSAARKPADGQEEKPAEEKPASASKKHGGKRQQREELLGAPLKATKKQTVDDELLGRPHVAEKAFASEGRPDATDPLHVTETPEERFAELQEVTGAYLSEEDEELLARAFSFADMAHKGQCRKSGEPFIVHPVEVALILADLRMDVETLCAAPHPRHGRGLGRHARGGGRDLQRAHRASGGRRDQDLAHRGGKPVGRAGADHPQDVRGHEQGHPRHRHQAGRPPAQHAHAGRLREDRRIFKSRETLEIYAPIAHRLGINSIKWELEDLAFFYLEPNKYKQISRMVTESRAEREEYLEQIIGILHGEMEKVGIQAQINRYTYRWAARSTSIPSIRR